MPRRKKTEKAEIAENDDPRGRPVPLGDVAAVADTIPREPADDEEDDEEEPAPKIDETVPGGLFIVGGKVVDSEGRPRGDYKVSKGKAVATGKSRFPKDKESE